MSLQERLDAFKATFESGAPAYNVSRERIEIMHRATDELRRSGLAERALKVGDMAPAFELDNQEGARIPIRSTSRATSSEANRSKTRT